MPDEPNTPNNTPNGGGATPPSNGNGTPAGTGNRNDGDRRSDRGSDSRSGEGDSDLIRSLRDEAANRRRDNATLTQSLTEAQTRVSAAEQERDNLRLQIAQRDIRESVSAHIGTLKTPHTAAIAALVDVSKVTIKDGKPDAESVKAAVEAVKTAHPALFNAVASKPSRTLTNDAGAKSDGSPQESHAAINAQIRRAAGRAG